MRKPEWLFVIALLLVGAYFSYRYFSRSEKFNILQLVPGSVALVYEANDPLKVYNKITSSNLWEGFEGIKAINQAEPYLASADSLFQADTRLANLLRSNKSLVTVHVTSNTTAGLMIYLPTGPGTVNVIEAILQSGGKTEVKRQTRLYDDYTITELRAGDLALSCILYDNYIVFSTYGFLIEDVVRNINKDFETGFFVRNSNLIAVPKLGDDAGNLYLNGEQTTALANIVLPPKSTIRQWLAQSGYVDISLSGDKLFTSGFLYDNSYEGFVSIFQNQEAGQPESVYLVSEDAAQVVVINVANLPSWYANWAERFNLNGDLSESLLANLKGDISISTYYNTTDANDKLILAKLADKAGAVNYLNRKAEVIAAAKNDTVYYEHYADLNIGLVEEEDYPASILGPVFSGFENTYFTVYDDLLVMAPTVERIKVWLNDIDNDLVWLRSVEKSSFIEENLSETSFALVYTNPWAWSLIKDRLNGTYRAWWQENEESLKQFGLLSFQFANLDNRYYVELKLSYDPQQVYVAQQELSDEQLTQFTGKLIVKPKLVKNHKNNQWEVLIQDSASFISLLDNSGELLWTDSLGENIMTDIYQVDFYKNRKLQYLFATDTTLHIIDRNGVEIEGYPISTGKVKIRDLFLIDYDKSRNYRFLTSDYSGHLYMRNKEGELLDGWNPLSIDSEISDQVFHVRVRGKDRIVIGLSNGLIQLRNRRGELQDGFPFDLQFNLENPVHFKTGSTFNNSHFTTISTEGVLVEFDLNGREYARRQVGEPASSARFSLAIDKARNDLIITRQDINRLTIFNKDGSKILEKDYDSNNPLDVQYYYLGVDKRLYIVRDKLTGRLFLYNKAGNLVNENPLFSDYPVSVVYIKKQSKCYIYTANNQAVEIKSFSF